MIDVFIINKSHLLCGLIAIALKKEPEIRVVGSTTRTDEALKLIPSCGCHVALVGADLPNREALKLTYGLKSEPSVKVLIMDLGHAKEAVLPYIEAGAAGYVFRDETICQLVDNIRAVHSGEALVSPDMAATLISYIAQLTALPSKMKGADRITDLTSREKEILSLIGDGLSNRQIADHLLIEEGTVKNHVHHILHKLNVRSRVDAATFWNGSKRSDGEGLDLGDALRFS
jgi:DNA-binding NarL/FixJ family response regulator